MAIVYVNWREQEILTKDEYEEHILRTSNNLFDDEDEFDEWLDDNYSASEILTMTDEEKEELKQKWNEVCLSKIRDEYDYYWEEYSIDIDG